VFERGTYFSEMLSYAQQRHEKHEKTAAQTILDDQIEAGFFYVKRLSTEN